MPDTKAYYSFRHTTSDFRIAQLRNRIAWIDYHQGQHELYMLDLPDGVHRKVLTSKGDDGQPLRMVDMSPSGRYLLLTRGEFSEGTPCSNPKHKAVPPVGQLQLIDLEQQHSVFAISGITTAVLAPDDSSLIWATKGTAYCQPLDGGDSRQLFSVRGEITSLHWSPSGHKLAFVCRRQERTLLGLYTFGSSRIRWVSPGFDRDSNPCWSPDSRHLAFVRFPGPAMDITERLFSDQADSFSVMLMNMETRHVRTVWQSSLEEHSGLSLQYGQRPLIWLGHQRLLFSHDNCGWDHIYQFNLADNHCSALTDGSWLVQDYNTSHDGSLLAFSHNRLRRHHYSLDIIESETGKRLDLPLSSGCQYWKPALTSDGGFLVFLSGDSRCGCHLGCLDMASGQVSRLTEADDYAHTVGRDFVLPSREIIKSRDSQIFYAQVFTPKGRGPFPAVLNIHGGPWMQSLPGFHPQLGMSFQYAFCQLLANSGFVVMDINYRGGSGYGKLFRQAPERGWDGASDYLDVQAAGHWLTRHAQVDRSRIGIIGESWGGYLGALALARDSGLFRAGVVINGCHNFPRELRRPHWGSTLFNSNKGETATECIARAKIAEESSPWGWLENWMSPVLLVHGDDDRTVSFEESQYLAHALKCRSVEVESLALPDEGHVFLLHESWLKIGCRAMAFLQKFLQG